MSDSTEITSQEHPTREEIQRFESARNRLWSQMLDALAQARGLGGVDALDKDGRDALEIELRELLAVYEELDVENAEGISTRTTLRKLWSQYHELGEQFLDILETGAALEDYDPDPDPTLTKEKAIEELGKAIAAVDKLVEDAEAAGISREELDKMLDHTWKKMIQ